MRSATTCRGCEGAANLRMIWRLMPTFVVSFLVVIVMLVNYYSPSLAGLAGIAIALVLSAFQGPYRPTLKGMSKALHEGLRWSRCSRCC